MKIAIIDFSANGEVVRGGTFANAGSILYSALKSQGEDVTFFEDITPFRIHRLNEKFDEYIFTCWSYGQFESIRWADFELEGHKSIIGYHPFAKLVELPVSKHWTYENIVKGLANLPLIFDELEFGLMSDCDLHVKSDDTRKVMPLFTSAGCPNRCKFCPVPALYNKQDKRNFIKLSIEDSKKVIKQTFDRNNNIHFLDEDFFLDTERTIEIINYMVSLQQEKETPIKWIALASVPSFYRVLSKVGEQTLLKSGLFLVELGLENSDVKLRNSMNKTGTSDQLEYILENSKNINKFWLTISLFPGETISTLNNVGDFLKKFGTPIEKRGNRLLTNGNIGGLGQFFQRYHGTDFFEKSKQFGMILDENPIRLMPSFIPNSLLDQIPKLISKPNKNELIFFKQYQIDENFYTHILEQNRFTIRELLALFEKKLDKKRFIMYICLMARLGHIVEA